MTAFTKTNPIGLDAVIAQVQNKLMQLETVWSVEIDGYPRCYPLDRDGKKGIEHFELGKDYGRSLIVKERNKFFFVFDGNPELVGNNTYNSELKLYFIINLNECKPMVTHRADSEVWADVSALLQQLSGIISIDGLKVDDVFNGYDYPETIDMQPHHAFRFDLTAIEYKLNEPLCIIN